MIQSTGETPWKKALPHLRCPACQTSIETHEDGFGCRSCERVFPVRNQAFVFETELDGNNRVAAEFYDSSRWERYRFWKRFTPFNDRAVTHWSREVLADLPELAGTRLLDVAIGDGRNMPLIDPECDIYGIDISAAQLSKCHELHSDRRLWLFLGEAEGLPFHDNCFDNTLSFGAFNYFSDPERALREMARVTKPGGLIVVTDEYANLPNRMIGSRIGWPALDRWIMSSFLHLGDEFTSMIEDHRDLRIEPIVDAVLDDWTIREVCNGWAYSFCGRST